MSEAGLPGGRGKRRRVGGGGAGLCERDGSGKLSVEGEGRAEVKQACHLGESPEKLGPSQGCRA